MPNRVDFLKAKVQAVNSVLEKTSPKERENRVSKHLALEFNKVLTDIAVAFPDAASHLPQPIPWNRPLLARNGLSDVSYVDLMIMAEQFLRVLSVVESHG